MDLGSLVLGLKEVKKGDPKNKRREDGGGDANDKSYMVQGERQAFTEDNIRDHLTEMFKRAGAIEPEDIGPRPPYTPGLLADKDYKLGELIFTSEPYAFVVNPACIERYCQGCFAKLDRPKRCSACKKSYYCSQECQKRDFIDHKNECKSLNANIDYRLPMPDQTHDAQVLTRLLARIVRKADREAKCMKFQTETVMGKANTFATLLSHYENMDKKDRHEQKKLKMIKEFLAVSGFKMGDENLWDAMGKMKVNFCNISTFCCGVVGTGLYLGFAFINHNCKPSAVVSFDKLKMSVRSTEPIKRGKEITITYCDLMRDKSTRQNFLKGDYFFNCCCERCEDPDWMAWPMDGLDYLNQSTGINAKKVCINPTMCFQMDLSQLEQGLKDWEEYASSHWLYYARAVNIFVERCYQERLYAECARWGGKAMEQAEYYCGKYSLEVAGVIMNWGNALLSVGKRSEAKEVFKKAFVVFKVSTGEGSWECDRARESILMCG